MSYQALYRRYRPRRFGQVRGQDHIVTGLRNAVRENRVSYVYLFSGPRGTGKTTTARILAKVLNCENPVDGEPCLECASCVAIEAGNSFDVHELDAASHNKVDDVRDLLEHVVLATPGRTKLYILDEVHMLTGSAEAALLKTLEEPPGGVVFVLATTDPQKVSATIRSRTQHFEFHLLPAAPLEEYVRSVVTDAGIDVDDTGIDFALRASGGSARDALSAIEQIAVAGGVATREVAVDDLVSALVERDAGRALVAVAEAVNSGRDPRLLAQQLVSRLRDVFLAAMKGPLDHLSDGDREAAIALAERFERPYITRCIETLGDSMTSMIEAVDQRIVLETALVRLTSVEVDPSPAALLERIERLENAVANGVPGAPAAPVTTPSPSPAPAPPQRAQGATARPADAARQALAEARGQSPKPTPRPAPTASPPAPPLPAAAPPTAPAPPPAPSAPSTASDLPSRDELTMAWGDEVLAVLPRAARARFAGGRFVNVDADGAWFALPNDTHRARCDEVRGDVEAALATHFGKPVPLKLVVDDGSTAQPVATQPPAAVEHAQHDEHAHHDEDDIIDVHELENAPAEHATGIDRVAAAFPGAELVVEEEEVT